MIEIKNLTKRYGKTPALSNLNLTVPDGAVFGLVGMNGAGKSTLLRLLAGVFRPDEGAVLIDGENVFENERRKKEIFFLPDEPFFTLAMDGLQVTQLYKAFYFFDDSIFKTYMNVYGLDLKTPLRNFSKGMKRQLFVSLAFACQAKYYFFDEVFDGLDPAARLVFKRGVADLTKSGGTVIISSHSLKELEDVCNSYGLIDGKKLVSVGAVDEIERYFENELESKMGAQK